MKVVGAGLEAEPGRIERRRKARAPEEASREDWEPGPSMSNSRGQRGSLPQTRRGLTLLSQLCRDPAVGVRNAEEA